MSKKLKTNLLRKPKPKPSPHSMAAYELVRNTAHLVPIPSKFPAWWPMWFRWLTPKERRSREHEIAHLNPDYLDKRTAELQRIVQQRQVWWEVYTTIRPHRPHLGTITFQKKGGSPTALSDAIHEARKRWPDHIGRMKLYEHRPGEGESFEVQHNSRPLTCQLKALSLGEACRFASYLYPKLRGKLTVMFADHRDQDSMLPDGTFRS